MKSYSGFARAARLIQIFWQPKWALIKLQFSGLSLNGLRHKPNIYGWLDQWAH